MSARVRRLLGFLARWVVVGLAAAFLLTLFAPDLVDRMRSALPGAASETRLGPVSEGDAGGGTSPGVVSFADAVRIAAPSVVNIYANKITTVRPIYAIPDLTQRLLGAIAVGPPIQRRDQNLGSGVIFSPDGYVLTNNHVISGADDIQVLLDDGRVAEAHVKGTDPWTDLAVLKINLDHLPTTAVADTNAVNVGDVVLAIGNPFGIGKTVTMGIVSAIGRQLNMSAYEDFIQTDAAINAGNSGGALVNSLGQLIGINTYIYPRNTGDGARGNATPSAEGIGFAIPVATAKAVMDQIIEHGFVVRGWIGAEYTDIPPANGTRTRPAGVLVRQIVLDSPAAKAGLRPGDELLKLDGKPISGQADLRNREAAFQPGTEVRLDGLRDGAPFEVKLTLAQRPAPSATGA
ncbi:MAG: trypsin-like peptidase domain-containing protein [Lysobacterales bacterium]